MQKKTVSRTAKKSPRGSHTNTLTAVLQREGDGYVSFCPELEIASQRNNVEEATTNLQEAVKLFLESASPSELRTRTGN
jgi:predicted RNase H-like HicB family nuclease